MAHRVILTGGGTGGHVYPALAVAEQLKKRPDVEGILYIGVKGHIEERLAKEAGLDFVGLNAIGLPRKISLRIFVFFWQFIIATYRSLSVMIKFKPTAILGTGGYAAAPALCAAVLTRLPIAIHEPDSNPGLVNKLFAPHARVISLGMEAAHATFAAINKKAQIIMNGNPLFQRYSQLPTRQQARQELGLNPGIPVVLVTGGSQGAQAINNAVYGMLSHMVADGSGAPFQILHQTGEKNWAEMQNKLKMPIPVFYKPRKYFDNLAQAYAACDLAVCRSGAMTISELAATGTPAIFVPYPFAAANHQTFNAKSISDTGAAKLIMQPDLNGTILYKTIQELLLSPAQLNKMRSNMFTLAKPRAASQLATQLLSLSS